MNFRIDPHPKASVARAKGHGTQRDRAMETNLRINDLIREAWQVYRQFADQPFLVKPSIPILFFGDSNRYFSSELKVITVGLNPSRIEFPEKDRFSRFS